MSTVLLAASRNPANNALVMSPSPENMASCASGVSLADRHDRSATDVTSPAPLFRFRLRHLLGLFTAASVLLAILASSHGVAVLAILLATLVVALHLLGTALGTRLRSQADLSRRNQARNLPPALAPIGTAPNACLGIESAECKTPWYARSGTASPWMPKIVAAAVFFGGCLGAAFLVATISHRTSPAGLVVGTLSLAALSGLFAFLAANLFGIMRGGLHEAAVEHDRPVVPR